MKICMHPKIHALSESFHKGELSLTDYRSLRRKELEVLNSASQKTKSSEHKSYSSALVKRVFSTTLLAICLVVVTVMLAKYLL